MSQQPLFQDYFSDIANQYAQFRPRYPSSLFEYLTSITTGHELAWDCATGSGQAAIALTQYFDRVIATDASEEQISNAESHSRVQFKVTSAENCEIETGTVNLITVAQALHWFDLPAFYAEVRRVLKPAGILAVWSYGKMKLDSPEIRSVIGHFYHETVGPYWPAERKLVETNYQTLDFPLNELESPAFSIEAAMTLDEILGYIRTWSATQRYQTEHGNDPVTDLAQELAGVWEEPEFPITVNWPIALRVGRV